MTRETPALRASERRAKGRFEHETHASPRSRRALRAARSHHTRATIRADEEHGVHKIRLVGLSHTTPQIGESGMTSRNNRRGEHFDDLELPSTAPCCGFTARRRQRKDRWEFLQLPRSAGFLSRECRPPVRQRGKGLPNEALISPTPSDITTSPLSLNSSCGYCRLYDCM